MYSNDEIWLFQRPYQQLFHKPLIMPFEVGFYLPVSDERSCYGYTVESENRLEIITCPAATGYLSNRTVFHRRCGATLIVWVTGLQKIMILNAPVGWQLPFGPCPQLCH